MSQAQARIAESTTLNGLEPAALEQAVAAISAEPAQGLIAFRATTSWQGRLRARTEISSYDLGGQTIARRHHVMSDEPLEVLGDNSAPNPQELLMSALASCMMVGFVVQCTVQGIRVDTLEIDTELGLDMRGAFGIDPSIPAGTDKVKYTIRVRGTGTREQFEEIHREVTKTSPNYFHIANPIPFESALVVE